MKPLISIVVNCFSRKDFVVEALKSACEQTISRSEYEIILIKNFHDEEIDSFVEESGIISICTDNITTGSWFKIAANYAKGEFISFLDDDDLIHPNKLDILQSVIQLDPEIVYIHNKSEETDSMFKKKEFNRSKVIYFRLDNRAQFRKSLKNRYYFNLSSITARKDILQRYMSFISETNHGTDFVIFSAASMSGKKMLEYDDSLTYFRIHMDSHGNFTAGSLAELEKKKMSVLPFYVSNWQIIYELQNRTILGEYAKLRFITTKIWLNLVSPKPVYKIKFAEVIDSIHEISLYPSFLPFIAVYYFDRLFHKASKKIYYIIIYSWLGWRLRENI